TEAIDLQQKMLMPGINDMHQHPVEGGAKELFECQFPFTAGPDEIAAAIAGCVAAQPDAEWIRGGQFSSDFFVQNPMESPREWLDKVSGDKAVALIDDAYHNAWLNSKALEKLGVTSEKDLPKGVEMHNDPSGKPDGFMIEAFGFVKDRLHWTPEQYEQSAAKAVELAHSFGITGLKATAIGDYELAAFKALADSGNLSAHVAGAIVTPYGHRENVLDIDELKSKREQYKAPNFNTNFVKIFMDGVPTAARTAAMLAPYTPAEEGGEQTSGQLHISAEMLETDLVALDAAGFTVKIHTAGDRSVQVALDAIESARKKNGDSGLRHELAHAGYVGDDDMNRFAELGAIPDFSPYIWFPSPIMDSVLTAVGERGEFYWPTKSLLASGALVSAGSDWPAAVPSMNPWPGIEAMVTRADPFANGESTLWADEAVPLQDALHIFTSNGAKALLIDDKSGSVALGKSADFIVLNQDLFKVPATQISDTQVLMTYFGGEKVYSR
ncbi:MAG: amidohydrolase, partial [Pseudomonadales bacterium]